MLDIGLLSTYNVSIPMSLKYVVFYNFNAKSLSKKGI